MKNKHISATDGKLCGNIWGEAQGIFVVADVILKPAAFFEKCSNHHMNRCISTFVTVPYKKHRWSQVSHLARFSPELGGPRLPQVHTQLVEIAVTYFRAILPVESQNISPQNIQVLLKIAGMI